MRDYFIQFANYNQQMNFAIIDAISKLDEHEIYADKVAFFSSIFGTMVHISVADIIWLRRFEKFDHGNLGQEIAHFPHPKSLDDVIFGNINEFIKARIELDKIIIQFIENLDAQDFSKELTYKNTKGIEFLKEFGLVLGHFFNHQTHHRGQVTSLLFQSGVDPGVTDLIAYLPDL
jgi:uncharacterized damage-inducible protein DinB